MLLQLYRPFYFTFLQLLINKIQPEMLINNTILSKHTGNSEMPLKFWGFSQYYFNQGVRFCPPQYYEFPRIFFTLRRPCDGEKSYLLLKAVTHDYFQTQCQKVREQKERKRRHQKNGIRIDYKEAGYQIFGMASKVRYLPKVSDLSEPGMLGVGQIMPTKLALPEFQTFQGHWLHCSFL